MAGRTLMAVLIAGALGAASASVQAQSHEEKRAPLASSITVKPVSQSTTAKSDAPARRRGAVARGARRWET